mmetsp:Transcript_736/g.1375  ORF Transcript_736/g.1375 Transcript_736/m.1375 type:complete len:184 (+) Transcript_736:65-616(+)
MKTVKRATCHDHECGECDALATLFRAIQTKLHFLFKSDARLVEKTTMPMPMHARSSKRSTTRANTMWGIRPSSNSERRESAHSSRPSRRITERRPSRDLPPLSSQQLRARNSRRLFIGRHLWAKRGDEDAARSHQRPPLARPSQVANWLHTFLVLLRPCWLRPIWAWPWAWSPRQQGKGANGS